MTKILDVVKPGVVAGDDLQKIFEIAKQEKFALILEELKKRDAVLVAHYYCDPEVQELAELSGGCVSDSLEMARFGKKFEFC